MLDPRIYRTGFVAVALAVIVVAFSLTNQQGSLGTTLAPDAFNGQAAYSTMTSLAQGYPDRTPGSTGDYALAADVARRFRQDPGFTVSTDVFKARTVEGTRTLENVTAIRAGRSTGSIVVVAHRDSLSSGAPAELSGTATLLQLAQVMSGETQHRTIVLASTSGSDGAAGAVRLARSLGGPVDAVIALGDLAGTHVMNPVVVPWSDGQDVAPPLLRNTLAAALSAQAGLRPGGTSLAGQLARLAYPGTLGEQGPFGAHGVPAVLLSASGERGPSANESTSPDQITALGRSVLETVSSLDGGPSVPAASSYLLYDGKVVPAWAIRLLVLALILPVIGATIDGAARARRRGYSLLRWSVWVLASAVPFALAVLVVIAARLTGLLAVIPPEPVPGGAVPLRGGGIATLVLAGLAMVLSFVILRPLILRLSGTSENFKPGGEDGRRNEGSAAALLLVACVVAIAIWVANPFAAALLIPALHLWMWIVDPELRLRPAVAAAFLLVGIAPPVLLIVYSAHTLGLGPLEVIWNGLLMVAGGHITLVAALEWSVALGCVASVVAITLKGVRESPPEEAPVTVRGPITYAGPGSLGGTESALRR